MHSQSVYQYHWIKIAGRTKFFYSNAAIDKEGQPNHFQLILFLKNSRLKKNNKKNKKQNGDKDMTKYFEGKNL